MTNIIFNEDNCKGCGLCEIVCPKKIVVRSSEKINAKGFHPASVIDPEKCIACAFCATICPDVVITIEK